MLEKITAAQIFDYQQDRAIIDVRSPSEYLQGHFPSAHNIPLFSDDERAAVGTTYKRASPEKALLQGLDFVGKKMSSFIKRAQKIAPNRKIIVYCWRGGKRSGSMAWLLEMAGFDVKVVIGGYKAYRGFTAEYYDNQVVAMNRVGGKTGTGKTEILKKLAAFGEQIIDLEGIAHHKGSAFGELGETPQPTNEQFENNLFHTFYALDKTKRIWVENESRGIGKVFLPEAFWKIFCTADLYNVTIPHHLRVERLVKDYAQYDDDLLVQKFENIEKKIGGQHKMAAVKAIMTKNYAEAVEIALVWYDKTYAFGKEKKLYRQWFNVDFEHADMEKIASHLIAITK
jgi:tRNA 2-selenouridine synthase